MQKVQFDVQQGQSRNFVIDDEGKLRKGTKLYAPNVHKLRKEILFKCFTSQQVKLERQRSSGLLRQLPIPEWKWGMITMDFVSSLPRTLSGVQVSVATRIVADSTSISRVDTEEVHS